MLNRAQLITLWLLWLMVGGGTLAGLVKGRSMRQQYVELLHSFLHRPTPTAKPVAMPISLNQQPQLPLQPVHQHKHDELHRALQQDQQAVAGHTRKQPAARQPLSGNATRGDVLHNLQSAWPDGYVAICAVVKDQNRDLRYWIEYHRWLGVTKFYIFDNNSTLPAMLVLWDYIREGIVDYQYFIGRPRRLPDFRDTNQYKAYHGCLLQHFRQHRWLAFIDIDEFFVFPPPNAAAVPATVISEPVPDSIGHRNRRNMLHEGSSSPAGSSQAHGLGDAAASSRRALQAGVQDSAEAQIVHSRLLLQDARPHDNSSSSSAARGAAPIPVDPGSPSKQNLALFLSRYEKHAAIGINWVMFGSSSLQDRPREGPLAAFKSCVPQEHWESTHVKVIANTGGILGVGPTPHEVVPRAGRSVVDVDGVEFKGPKTPTCKWHKLVIHHYVLKSRAEFAAKKARGSGAGNVKEWSFFDYMDGLSNMTCTWGQPISRAYFASKPRLRPPRGANSICGMRSKLQIDAAASAAGGNRGAGGTDGEVAPLPAGAQQQPLRKQQAAAVDEMTPSTADDVYGDYL